MVLKIKHFVVFITIITFACCKRGPLPLGQIAGSTIVIDSTLKAIDSVSQFIAPYHNRVNQVLDSTLTYAPYVISKTDGVFNTSAGNLLADIVLAEAGPIFKSRTGKDLDFALLNHGGIRSIISKGNVTSRTAYEVMPFENSIVVVELTGKSVADLVSFLVDSGRAHPVAGIKILLDRENKLKAITIKGRPLDYDRNYFIATSNYLATGGDDMVFFKDAITLTETDYMIRNAMIDYFKKVDTLKSAVDDRFGKIE